MDNGKLPTVEDLLMGWIIQLKKLEIDIVNQIASWLLKQLDYFRKELDKIQNDILDSYQEKLDRANLEINLNYENERNVWLIMEKQAHQIKKEVDNLRL
jgi:hypothetical protein